MQHRSNAPALEGLQILNSRLLLIHESCPALEVTISSKAAAPDRFQITNTQVYAQSKQHNPCSKLKR